MKLRRHASGRRQLATSILACAAALAAGDARAQTTAPRAADCGTDGTISGEVARVIDGRSFLFADGREVRLAGIEVPLLVPGDEDDARVAAAMVTRHALEALVLHHEVALRTSGAGQDRYGRLVAYALVRATDKDTPVQHALVAAGQALVSPGAMAAACRASLRGAERAARAAKLGLWGDPYYVVRQADNIADVLGEQGRFALVEGRVASVRESGGIVYVNFGRRWSQDFTVTNS